MLEAPSLLHSLSQQDRFGSAEAQYNVSKLFGMYAINELAAKATGEEGTENVIINSVNPGATATSLALRIVAFVYLRLLARVVEQCSYSLVSACTFGMESQIAGTGSMIVSYVSSAPAITSFYEGVPTLRGAPRYMKANRCRNHTVEALWLKVWKRKGYSFAFGEKLLMR